MRLTILALACTGTVLAQAPAEPDWSRLRASGDNSVRSLLVRDLPRTGVDPEIVIRRLRVEPDVSARRALLLARGGYDHDRITPAQRAALAPLLREWLETDPDGGIHSAIQWLYRTRSFGPLPSLPVRPAPALRWLVTAEGQTMARLDGPLSVTMGSPPDEAGRRPASDSPNEPLHDVRIPRTFAIATTEVTVAEFRRFLDTTADAKRAYDEFTSGRTRMAEILARFSPTDDSPAIAMTW